MRPRSRIERGITVLGAHREGAQAQQPACCGAAGAHSTAAGLQAMAPSCAQCGAAEAADGSGAPLKTCVRCRAVHYCGPTCQRTHWKGGHRYEQRHSCVSARDPARATWPPPRPRLCVRARVRMQKQTHGSAYQHLSRPRAAAGMRPGRPSRRRRGWFGGYKEGHSHVQECSAQAGCSSSDTTLTAQGGVPRADAHGDCCRQGRGCAAQGCRGRPDGPAADERVEGALRGGGGEGRGWDQVQVWGARPLGGHRHARLRARRVPRGAAVQQHRRRRGARIGK